MLSMSSAYNAYLTRQINKTKESPDAELIDFLPYPEVFRDEEDKAKKVTIAETTKAYLKKNKDKLPYFVQAVLNYLL